MFVSLLLLAMARARQVNVYASVSIGMLKTQSLRVFLRETMPLQGGASLLLLFNYWIASGLILYLIADYYALSVLNKWIVSVTAPIALLFFQLFSMIITGWVTGEREVFKTPIAMKLIGTQFLGVIYFLCALFWVLQPDYVNITLDVVVWAFLIESAFRILKSVSVVIRQGVAWYYIILYFCTLEILPFMVFYFYAWQNLLR